MKKIILFSIFMLLKIFTVNAQEKSSINKIKVSKAKPSMAVQLSKMNVLYIGVDNPVEIAVSGINTFYISMAKGTITQNENSFLIKETKQGIDTLFIYDVKNHLIDKRLFRVKPIPNPVACIGNYCGYATISKNELLAQRGLIVMLLNFDFDLFFKINHFQMTVYITGSNPVSFETKTNLFTDEMKKFIATLSSDTKITFEYIDAIDHDGQVRRVDPLDIVLK